MFTFEPSNPVPVARVEFTERLNAFAVARVWPSGSCPVPPAGADAALSWGGDAMQMQVDDFNLTPGGGWMRLSPAAARAAPFDLEVFSGEEGVSFRAVLESRAAVTGPPELGRKVPAVTADCAIAELLDDICARTTGWAWWTGLKGIEIGPPAPDTQEVDGTVVSQTATGARVRLTKPPPRVGTRVRLPCGTSGVIVSADMAWEAGGMPLLLATLAAECPPCRPLRSRGTACWPARVKQLNPLMVELIDEDRPGRKAVARAQLMARRGDNGRFQEDLPLRVGDPCQALLECGGVSTRPVKVYPWSEAIPLDAYRIQTHSAELVTTERLRTTAGYIEEKFERRTSRVADRWDINRG